MFLCEKNGSIFYEIEVGPKICDHLVGIKYGSVLTKK